jgi:hypothetical protein
VKNRYGWKKMAQIATIVTEASARLYNQKGQDAGTGLGLARFDRAFGGSPLAGAVHDENPFFKENRGRGPLFLGEERALFSRVRDQDSVERIRRWLKNLTRHHATNMLTVKNRA